MLYSQVPTGFPALAQDRQSGTWQRARFQKSLLLKKKKKEKKSDTSWALGTKVGTTCSRPGFCRQTNRGASWIPQRGGPGALGSLWLCLVAQTIAWVRGCNETVNPPSKVLKSFPLALVDLCGLELIIDWSRRGHSLFPVSVPP